MIDLTIMEMVKLILTNLLMGLKNVQTNLVNIVFIEKNIIIINNNNLIYLCFIVIG